MPHRRDWSKPVWNFVRHEEDRAWFRLSLQRHLQAAEGVGRQQPLLDVIQNGTKGDDERLQLLDQIVVLSFVAGVVLTGAIALSAGYSHMHRLGAAMTQENRAITMTKVVTDLEKRSLTGIGNLAPTTPAPQPASTSQSAGATATQGQTGGPSQGSPK